MVLLFGNVSKFFFLTLGTILSLVGIYWGWKHEIGEGNMSVFCKRDNHQNRIQILPKPYYYWHSRTCCSSTKSEKSGFTGPVISHYFENCVIWKYNYLKLETIYIAGSSSCSGVVGASQNAAQRIHYIVPWRL